MNEPAEIEPRAVQCPRCGARPGIVCRTPQTRRIVEGDHRDRHARAREENAAKVAL